MELTKEQWLEDLSAVAQRTLEMTKQEGDEFAQALFDPFFEEGFTPKDALDEKLSYWTE